MTSSVELYRILVLLIYEGGFARTDLYFVVIKTCLLFYPKYCRYSEPIITSTP